MQLETEIQNRLLGITPSHELQEQYAAIFRASPDLAFAKAYADGYFTAGSFYIKIIERLVRTIVEEQTCK